MSVYLCFTVKNYALIPGKINVVIHIVINALKDCIWRDALALGAWEVYLNELLGKTTKWKI